MTENMMTSSDQQPVPTPPSVFPQTPPIDSERYRQMLVRDGERRFREWHQAFLQYQQQFQQAMRGQ
ncbi:MAG: hypothetical protein HC818_03370 [Synechococcaceae cyanobacterium RM1_1_27]|nr:hypothetical protein [Synechococcaceae cyanobacterium SM2_3_2]NJO85783.1 hypothetical protein [Synechococcaceae cyanobacterium RM1_1_27]